MITTPNAYSATSADATFGWSRAVLLATLALSLTLVFDANLQVVAVTNGKTFEFLALAIGLFAVGVGLLAGAGFSTRTEQSLTPVSLNKLRLRKPSLQISIALLVALQALAYYLLNGRILLMGIGATTLESESQALSFLFTASPLFLVAFLSGVRLRAILSSSRPHIAIQFPLALVAGVGSGALIHSFGASALGAPILLLVAAGALLSGASLSRAPADLKTHRVTRLALVGALAVIVIAQVLLVREEQQTIDRISHQRSSALVENKLLWTYSAQPLIKPLPFAGGRQFGENTFRLLATLFEDSVSVLLLDGGPDQLKSVMTLNCADVTCINSSALQSFVNQKTISPERQADDNHIFKIETGEGLDLLMRAERRWDIIYLSDGAGVRQIDPFQPAVQETREFFAACLTHLTDRGFIVFDADENSNSLTLFRRLTGVSSALEARGVENSVASFTTLPSATGSSTVALVSSQAKSNSIRTRIRAAARREQGAVPSESAYFTAKLRACFQPGIEVALSNQYGADLSHITLDRPYPGVLRPARLTLTQAVYASPLGGTPQAEVSTLYDALSRPVATLAESLKTMLIATIMALVALLTLTLALTRKALNHSVRVTRRRQRGAFLLFTLWLSGFLVTILPQFYAQSLSPGTGLLPTQITATISLMTFGVGMWLSSRRRSVTSFRPETGLIIAMLVVFSPFVLSYLPFDIVADSSPAGFLLSSFIFIGSSALFGATTELCLRRERLLETPDAVSLLTALLFSAIGAMILARISTVILGFVTTMELGFLLLVLAGALQILAVASPAKTHSHLNYGR